MAYVREEVASKEFTNFHCPRNIDYIAIEVNLYKTKWVLLGIYRPPATMRHISLKKSERQLAIMVLDMIIS